MEQTAAAQQEQMASMEEMTASAQELAHAAEEMKNQGSSFVSRRGPMKAQMRSRLIMAVPT